MALKFVSSCSLSFSSLLVVPNKMCWLGTQNRESVTAAAAGMRRDLKALKASARNPNRLNYDHWNKVEPTINANISDCSLTGSLCVAKWLKYYAFRPAVALFIMWIGNSGVGDKECQKYRIISAFKATSSSFRESFVILLSFRTHLMLKLWQMEGKMGSHLACSTWSELFVLFVPIRPSYRQLSASSSSLGSLNLYSLDGDWWREVEQDVVHKRSKNYYRLSINRLWIFHSLIFHWISHIKGDKVIQQHWTSPTTGEWIACWIHRVVVY